MDGRESEAEKKGPQLAEAGARRLRASELEASQGQALTGHSRNRGEVTMISSQIDEANEARSEN
ncbi:hypothetical protein CFIMG_002641RA [Ceratocystis fimbriata CBS 114723]|uniref:Uncharacterized protein n=1 Tax=Ceratocystis fimbriata CBS 114723 TaxID=1035309 RepID=A0A2C5XGZ7_9PEZI|nr:hypothetical protein CFIMG_002641RA [Ceratocystis fimbriata CBS 114723]